MNLKKTACGMAVSATLVASFGLAGTGFAQDYAPTLLGNNSYSNQIDPRNAYDVEGVYYIGSISRQNADTVAQAKEFSTVIGGTETDTSSPIIVTNDLDKSIVSFSIRDSSETAFSGNMLSGSLGDGESAVWNYEYAYSEETRTNSIGKSIVMPVNYTIQVAFENGETAEFHDINMNGVRTIALCWSDEYQVYYVERTTITNHTPDPNLYYEANRASESDKEEFNLHVNSAGNLGQYSYNTARGGAWNTGQHEPTQTIADFGIDLPLFGYHIADFNDEVYGPIAWNSDNLVWRQSNNQ